MAASRVREIIEKGTDAFNRHDADAFAETLADDVRTRAPGVGELAGKPAVKAFYQGWLDAFPDARVEIGALHILEDLSVEEGVFTGTHRGTLHAPAGDLPPTGRKVRVDYIQVARFRGDKVVSFHLAFDQLELLLQLGLMQAAEAEAPTRRPDEAAGEGLQTH
jgi:predicted ester cyclase